MGDTNRKLTLEARTEVGDGAGGLVEAWEEIGVIWASLSARTGRERMIGGRPSARVTHKALIRHMSVEDPARPRPDQRFREGERVFAIRAVAEADDRRERLICWLEEGGTT